MLIALANYEILLMLRRDSAHRIGQLMELMLEKKQHPEDTNVTSSGRELF